MLLRCLIVLVSPILVERTNNLTMPHLLRELALCKGGAGAEGKDLVAELVPELAIGPMACHGAALLRRSTVPCTGCAEMGSDA